jgi:hypothetical protein
MTAANGLGENLSIAFRMYTVTSPVIFTSNGTVRPPNKGCQGYFLVDILRLPARRVVLFSGTMLVKGITKILDRFRG